MGIDGGNGRTGSKVVVGNIVGGRHGGMKEKKLRKNPRISDILKTQEYELLVEMVVRERVVDLLSLPSDTDLCLRSGIRRACVLSRSIL